MQAANKYGFTGCFAPNIVMKGYVTVAVSCIRPYCMVKNRQSLYKMCDNLLLRLCMFAVAIHTGCVRLKLQKDAILDIY